MNTMSTTGILSQDYYNTAGLFKEINKSIITLKKQYYNLPGAKNITELEIKKSREFLADIIGAILVDLGAEIFTSKVRERNYTIPPLFIQRLKERHKAEMPYYLEDLKELYEILSADDPIQLKHIKLLDELCDQLDSETISMYRKLLRK